MLVIAPVLLLVTTPVLLLVTIPVLLLVTTPTIEQPAPSGGRLFALLATNAYVINSLLQHWPEPVGSPAR